jgi:hypothetical protein
MKRALVTVVVLLGTLGGKASADPQMLWSTSTGGGGGLVPGEEIPPEDRWVEFTIYWGHSPDQVVFGEGLHWPEGASGYHDFPDESTSPEDWALFVDIVTTASVNDGLAVCWDSPIWGECYELTPFDLNLEGYQIDYLRLEVDSVVFDPFPPGVSVSCSAEWQIWGVPEPGTLIMFVLSGSLVGLRRRAVLR